MINLVGQLGVLLTQLYKSIYSFVELSVKTIYYSFIPPYRFKDIMRQFSLIAVDSLPVILFCVGFAAVIVVIEASFHMKLIIGDDSLVPGFVAILILRELGVVVAALLLTSRVGASIAAEVSSMKITEQIDALKMLGINPIRFLVVPRFIASIFAGIVLSIVASIVCLYFAMIVTQMKLGFSSGHFLQSVKAFIDIQDLYAAAIKGAVFGAVIPLFSCWNGFRCKDGAEGVGSATTHSVVSSSVAIIFLDFILGYIFSYIY